MATLCYSGLSSLFKAKGKKRSPRQEVHAEECSKFILVNSKRSVDDIYVPEKTLGVGGFGTVRKCLSRKTGAMFVMKSIIKDEIPDVVKFQTEIEIQAELDHPHIVRLYETFENHSAIDIVLEVCLGGTTDKRVTNASTFDEAVICRLFKQIMSGVYFMHDHANIAHRDLKPENILIKEDPRIPLADATCKIIDFGLSARFQPGTRSFKDMCGTPFWAAPEVFSGHKYNEKCDIFSCGMILHNYLCADLPYDEKLSFICDKTGFTQRPVFSFRSEAWTRVSPSAKVLILQMCKVKPDERPSPHQVLSDSAWVKQHDFDEADTTLQTETVCEIATSLSRYSTLDLLQKTALIAIANVAEHEWDEDIAKARATFKQLDPLGSGSVDLQMFREHFMAWMRKLENESETRPSLAEVDNLFKAVDIKSDGHFHFSEWLAANLPRHSYLEEHHCWEAFRIFDKDGCGHISKDDLFKMLGENAATLKLLETHDTDDCGELTFDEFMDMLRSI